jgi:hypothetical protein
MENGILSNIVYLIKETMLSPRRLFENIRDGKFTREIYISFFCGALLTFVKSLLINRKSFASTFFTNDVLNSLVVLLNNPQVYWFVGYVGYFIFILLVLAMCKLFNKQAVLKPVALAIMSLGGLGVTMQILFYVLKFTPLHNLILFVGYLVFLWVVFLSITAIKTTQNMSYPKAIICFLIPALPAIFMAALTGIAPYLAWLTVRS